ncbi:hypothetical protein CVT91_06560 [Candidatus Atribacteria bacterium HGW-Atribacteria-1]|nr:MAG: hypothetical protein CVT91_06560 [Candidatus Atribacteria bacterium HGW-Atribacteria-1]
MLISFQRKIIILIGISILSLILFSGCLSYVLPDYDSYTVSFIKITPSSVDNMKVNESRFFTVKAYDIDGYQIPIDKDELGWSWSPQCCKVAELYPKTGSIKTTFIPGDVGSYKIKVYYKGKFAYSTIMVKD